MNQKIYEYKDSPQSAVITGVSHHAWLTLQNGESAVITTSTVRSLQKLLSLLT